jgi:hypothetical protein
MRKSDFYRRLTPLEAIDVVSDASQMYSREDQLIAWQWLADTGLAMRFPETFGHMATKLIKAGLIEGKRSSSS